MRGGGVVHPVGFVPIAWCTRREVMGDNFVARALGGATAFTRPIQDDITRNAWGDVWQRPGLDRRTRSLLTVAMCTARSTTA